MIADNIPQEAFAAIGSENIDFAIKSKHEKPIKESLDKIYFSIFWLALTSIGVFHLLQPVFQNKVISFTSGGIKVIAGPGNLEPIIMPLLGFGIFVLAGIIIFYIGLSSLLKDGGYYIGTPTKLIYYGKKNIKSTDWGQFTENIEITGDNQKADLAMRLKTGITINTKKGEQYIPDMIYICGISNVFEIANLCRKRIEENRSIPLTTNNIT